MRITFQIGAHHTRAPLLTNAINKNRQMLLELNIVAPYLRQQNRVFGATLKRLDGLPPILHEENEVLNALLGDCTGAHSMLLQNESMIGDFNRMFDRGRLYASNFQLLSRISEFFSQHEIYIALALRNPAHLVSSVANAELKPKSLRFVVDDSDPTTLSWVDTVDQLQNKFPQAKFILWRDEDAPLIWPRILKHLTNAPEGTVFTDAHAVIQSVLSPEGISKFQSYLNDHPDDTSQSYEQAVQEIFDEFALDQFKSPPCDVPGWTPDIVRDLTLDYDEDVEILSQRDHVTLIAPMAQMEPLTLREAVAST